MDRNVMKLPTELFILTENCTQQEFFDQFYDTKKFRRWFNVKPVVWISFDKDYLEEKCVARISFMLPPFSYKLICKKVIPNEYIELEVSGLLRGKVTVSFNVQQDGILMEHPMELQGINNFIHFYYNSFLRPSHIGFMDWRYKFLRKNLINERTNK